ncbi:MAG: phosphoglycerate dehydrogenase [Chloroflexi bacterium]|nr:phosphoglycerate dehydrogenase [Chloroflexota bacterium]
MVKISIPDDQPPLITDSPALARLRAATDAEVALWDTRPTSEVELLERISDAHTVICIRSTSHFTRHVIESSPALRHIARWGPGVDNIDLDAAGRMKIMVTNTPDTATDAVAEHCLALMLAVARKVPEIDARVRAGEWPRGLLTQLSGKTLGIVGTGLIGRRLARIAQGIGMSVIAWTRRPDEEWAAANQITYVELKVLLRESDVISLHLRLSAETRNIFSSDEFSAMKPTAILINVARGGLINENALADALRDSSIAGVGLDTFSSEPLPTDSPLRNIPNAILSPHTAGTTAEALTASLEMVVDNALQFMAGKTQNGVI